MRITCTKESQLSMLLIMLKKACHAPGCLKVRACPNQCGCRTKRNFALNMDTAICWEIADILHHLKNNNTVPKREVENIRDRITAYAELSSYHSSEGWQNFFCDVKRIYNAIMFPNDNWWTRDIEYEINLLSSRSRSLKRYSK